jgi:peptide/nickel transport system permease protein
MTPLPSFFRPQRFNALTWSGALLVGGLILLAVAAPWGAALDPMKQDLSNRLQPPSRAHWLGTDDLGRDVATRLLVGARVSLTVGALAVALSVFFGVLVGILAGYHGGWVDAVLMRGVDVLLCFPTIFLILMVIAFLEPSVFNVMAIIGATSWMGLARLVRGEMLSLRERDFVWSARGLGLSTPRLLWVHLMPHLVSPIAVAATLGVGGAIMTESALSFLGLGVQPPAPSWGNMLSAGKDYLHVGWWLSLFPGLAIFLTVLGFNMLGEGLRDHWDPRARK